MIVEIKIPEVGESITEGFLVDWLKDDGDMINLDDELFELETDKITMNIQAESAGQLKIIVQADTTVAIGQVVGSIDTDVQASSEAGDVEEDSAPAISTPAGMPQVEEKLKREDLDDLAPAVRRMVAELNVDPKQIKGTGKDGRIIKGDVLNYVADQAKPKPAEAKIEKVQPVVKKEVSVKATETLNVKMSPAEISERQVRKPMSRLRQRLAERLVSAQHEAAILTTFNEVDMSEVIKFRAKYKESFLDKYGIKLGFMSFFLKATIEALKKVPAVNAQIDGNDIIYNNFYNIGVAVSTDNGLVVPVVRDADKLSFGQIEQVIAGLGKKARDRKLTLDDLQGGTFSISNGGIFGSMMSTPILNPPQSGILGMHAIKKRPFVVGPDDSIEVRPMMYLAVSYDHRIIDGSESVTFLKHIKECLENPERIMFEV
jgi:2-oxoglutarate dehydrogenase E2 component (dihydrolipoamide succinyltransferase)